MASTASTPSPASAEPLLIPQGDYAGKPPLRLQKSVVVVGAADHCHLHLVSSSVSRHHALIIHDHDGVYIRDLGSRTKVVINGQPHREAILCNEDEIHIGKFSFKFSFSSAEVDPVTAVPPMRFTIKGRPAPFVTSCRTVLIGKDDGCDIALREESASHRHAVIFTAKGKRYLRDLDSRTGTFLGGEKIHQHELVVGSEIRVGETVITVAEVAATANVIAAPAAVAADVVAEAVAETAVHSGDTLPLPLEPETEGVEAPGAIEEPAAKPVDVPEPVQRDRMLVENAGDPSPHPAETSGGQGEGEKGNSPFSSEALKMEPVSDAKAGGLESALADAAKDMNKDSVPVEAEPEPVKTLAEAPEFLKLEVEPDAKTDGLESAVADAEIHSSKDSIPVEPEPVATGEPAEALEPIKLEAETETDSEIDLSKDVIPVEPEAAAIEKAAEALESVKVEAETKTDAEIVLRKDAILVEPEPAAIEKAAEALESVKPEAEIETRSEEPVPPALAGVAAAEVEAAEPVVERAEHDPLDLSLDLEPPPAEEQKPAVADEAGATLTEPEIAAALASGPTESPIDLNLDLNIEGVEKVEAKEPPAIEPIETAQPKIELTPMAFESEEQRNPPQQDVPEEARVEGSTVDVAPSETSEESADRPRTRPARGRKAAPKSETKAPKSPRAKTRRLPPQPVESGAEVASGETGVETPPETSVNWPGDMELPTQSTGEEIPQAFMPDDPAGAGIAPAVSVQPQTPETSESSEEESKDVWHIPPVLESEGNDEGAPVPPIPEEYSAEAPLLSGEMEILETPLEDTEEPFEGHEIAREADDATGGGWKIPESATEEITPPIISEDQTGQGPVISSEAEIAEAPVVGEGLSSGDWALPAAPSAEISAPIAADERIEEPAVPQPSPPPAAPAPVERSPAQFFGTLSSLGGYGFTGGGTVNLDHFFGGMPITLPDLPPTPPGFGRVKIDMTGEPLRSPMAGPVSSTGTAAGPKPPIEAPLVAPPSPPQPAAGPPPPSLVSAPTQRAAAPPPSPVAPAAPPPQAPPPQPPPVSFTPRPPRKPEFATDVYHPLDGDLPDPLRPTGSARPTTAFEGLAMGVTSDADVFSNIGMNPTAINDAAFGGAAMSPVDDIPIPESPERAKRTAENPEKDFAEDDFWNRTDEEDGVAPITAPAAPAVRPSEPPPPAVQPPETPPPAATHAEEFNDLPEEEPVDTQTDAAIPPAKAIEAPPPAKRRRFRIPFFMPLILVGAGVGLALGAIWRFIRVESPIDGTMTFLNYNYIPGTQDSIDFEATQRRLLDEQTREHAAQILSRDFPGIGQGFLTTPELFDKVAATVALSSSDQSVPPQTLLQLSYTSSEPDGDRVRMLALLEALADRNAPLLDANRQLREQLRLAQQVVDDDQQKLDGIKSQLSDLTPIIDAAPPAAQLDDLTNKKTALEKEEVDAEAAVTRDHADLRQLAEPAAAGGATQPGTDDPELKQMRQQLADLSAEVESARSDQLAGAALARQKLEAAARQFDDQIASANALLGGGSQLRQFVDSAMESQARARDLINMLIVDGEDLEQQLEDTRRDVEDLIQTQQDEKWAMDPQLQSLRENLESAQHRYNANVGQGVTDPRILDPLQKEIDNWTVQVKDRQAQLGADPGEIRVQESLNSIIDAIRKKLAKEKHQTDEVLDPLEKQLAALDPQVAGLPAAQQEVARQIHERLDALNDARQKFADTFGDEQLAPSSKVTELKNRIADLKAGIAARQADVERAAVAARDQQHRDDMAAIQARLQTDQKSFDDASKALEAGLSAYDEVHAKQVAADGAQQKKLSLLDDQRSAFADLEAARRDRDEKQSAADHAYDIRPVTAADVVAIAPPDPRMMYSVAVMGGGLIAVALAAVATHGGPRRAGKKSEAEPDFDALVIPLASDDDHAATA